MAIEQSVTANGDEALSGNRPSGPTPGPWRWFNYPDGRKLLCAPDRAVIHAPDAPISVEPADAALIAKAPDLLRLADGAWHLCEALLACRDAIPDDSIRAMSMALRTAIDEASISPATLAPSPAGAGAGNTAPAPPSPEGGH